MNKGTSNEQRQREIVIEVNMRKGAVVNKAALLQRASSASGAMEAAAGLAIIGQRRADEVGQFLLTRCLIDLCIPQRVGPRVT